MATPDAVAALQGLSVKELKRRARELGVPGREIDELDAADDIKTAAIQLVLRHDKDPLADLTAELEKLTVKELKKRAKADGASTSEVDDLDDAADIKAAAIGLIVKLSQPKPPVVMGKPVVSDKAQGGKNDEGAAGDVADSSEPQLQVPPAVKKLLADANLEAFGAGLARLGVRGLSDLREMEDDDFAQLSMQKVEVRRLRRRLNEGASKTAEDAPAALPATAAVEATAASLALSLAL